MPLVACPECQKEVSTAASACPGCGHPLGNRPIPVRIAPPEKKGMGIVAKVLLTVVGLFAALMIFGALIPENVAKANEARRACMEMAKQGLTTPSECDRMADQIRHREAP